MPLPELVPGAAAVLTSLGGFLAVVATQLRHNADGRRRADVDRAALGYNDLERQRRAELDARRMDLELSRLRFEIEEATRKDSRERARIELERLRVLASAGQLDKISFLRNKTGMTWETDPAHVASQR